MSNNGQGNAGASNLFQMASNLYSSVANSSAMTTASVGVAA